ncbi:MAG TPA: signal peptidase I [Opitutaceae bacterium]|nr:signal peptidase I [Opitutaceae bacterium]
MFNPTARRSLLVSAALLASAVAPRLQAANMSYEAAIADALTVAAQRSDLSVMRVAGQSMLPYFSDDAVIVVKKIDAARLRIGMIAVYVNRFGEKVAHRVIATANGGWQVKGYNNDAADSTVVNGSNLLGIVYATFHSAGRAPVTVAAASVPAVETVYAAPAK